jgi:hypothetical protein
MPFLARNQVKAYKDLELGEVTNPNPLTIKYEFADYSPNNLVKFIWLVHERKGLKPILPFGAYVNHIKKLLEELSGEEIADLILNAGEVSNHPFTVKFLRKIKDEQQKD